MILKFIFEKEIHLCSDPPVDFYQLQSFLTDMFKSNLPCQLSLYYVTPEDDNVPLETDEDYQTLLSLSSNKPIKVVITEKIISPLVKSISDEEHMDSKEYEVISQLAEIEEKQDILSQEEKPKEEEEISLVKLNEKEMPNSAFKKSIIPQIHFLSQLQEQQGEITKEEQFKSMLKTALQEQMPFIVSQLREALIQEDVFELKQKEFVEKTPASNNPAEVRSYINSYEDCPLKELQNNSIPNDEEYEDTELLFECPEGCGRKFRKKALERHAQVCKKVFQSKRKQFDSTHMKQTNADNWRVEFEAFRANLEAGRGWIPNQDAQYNLEQEVSNVIIQCENCGLMLNENAAARHIPSCDKFQNKRKQFDLAQMRQIHEQIELNNENKYNGMNKIGSTDKTSKWRVQSEIFKANLKAARGKTLTQDEQDNLAQLTTDHLIQCDNCGRKFNENAAARHIPVCEKVFKSKIDSAQMRQTADHLIQCDNCGRRFNKNAAARHIPVCAKVFKSKIDSAQMRQTDEQIELNKENKYSGMDKKGTTAVKKGETSKWRAQSEAMRATSKAGRGVALTQDEQDNLARVASNSRTQCENCGRKFNKNVAVRHVLWCKEDSQRKREQFDFTRKRLTFQQMEIYYQNKSNDMAKKGQQKKYPAVASKWRVESEALRAFLKAGRSETLTQDEQNSLSQAASYGLIPCKSCSRKFNERALEIHAQICVKVFQSKREQFDSAQMRKTKEQMIMELNDKNKYNSRGKKIKQKKRPEAASKVKTCNWREESEAFRANLKAAMGRTLTQATSFVLILSENYNQKFNENPATNHIPMRVIDNIPDKKEYIEFLEKKIEQLQQELSDVRNQLKLNSSSFNQLPQINLEVTKENRPDVQQQSIDDNNQEGVPYYLNQAKEFMSSLSQGFEGDPFIHCPEGKYKQSTVDKVKNLREWFPEEDKKELLDFVEKFPKETPLDRLVDVYVGMKKHANKIE